MIIDSHQHFWIYDPKRLSWINEDMLKLRMDFLPKDLKPVLESENVDGCISVQADQSELDTNFLLELSAKHEFILGVVGWLDMQSSDFPNRLEYFSQYKNLKGLRHIVQDEPDVNFLLRKEFINGIKCLADYNLRYDILVYPHQLGAALELILMFPDQLFVIDHLAKPYIKDGFFHGWATLMKAISRCENVYCKLSGFLTEANWQLWKEEDFAKYFDLILQDFGADRIMFGSDWPVCLLTGQYSQVIQLVRSYIQSLSSNEQSNIMGGTAMEFYQLKR